METEFGWVTAPEDRTFLKRFGGFRPIPVRLSPNGTLGRRASRLSIQLKISRSSFESLAPQRGFGTVGLTSNRAPPDLISLQSGQGVFLSW